MKKQTKKLIEQFHNQKVDMLSELTGGDIVGGTTYFVAIGTDANGHTVWQSVYYATEPQAGGVGWMTKALKFL